jgi:hypothetical protein
MPHEVSVIKAPRFAICRQCKGVTFELALAAKHVARSIISSPAISSPRVPNFFAEVVGLSRKIVPGQP